MKNYLKFLLALLLLAVGVLFYFVYFNKIGSSSQEDFGEMTEMSGFKIMPAADGFDMEALFEVAKKCVVRISMDESVGSGVIWNCDDRGLIIIANRHLLEEGLFATVQFWNGTEIPGKVASISEAYDIGIVVVDDKDITDELVNDIYIARHPQTVGMQEGEILWTVGEPVLQTGYIGGEQPYFTGTVTGKEYMYLFNTQVMVTECYTRAGMSGGLVVDRFGSMIGMISGGDVPEDSVIREADVTYSLPIELLEENY